MFALGLNPSLRDAARFPRAGAGSGLSAAEAGILTLAGLTAAVLTAYVEMSVRVPGHVILFAVAPMTLGMALVPRRGAGSLMAVVTLLAAIAIRSSGTGELPIAAMLGLAAAGVLLDGALGFSTAGARLYLRGAAAGVAANLLVYAAKWMSISGGAAGLIGSGGGGGGGGGGGNFLRLGWWVPASFIACGAAAGLLAAMVGFRPRAAGARHEDESHADRGRMRPVEPALRERSP